MRRAVRGSRCSGLRCRCDRSHYYEEAVISLHEALKEQTRERVPLGWAATQQNLGNALTSLDRFEEAVFAFRESLKESTRERVPRHWAKITYSLGNALWLLGVHAGRTDCLEEAIEAYRAALSERTFDGKARDHAENSIVTLEEIIRRRPEQ